MQSDRKSQFRLRTAQFGGPCPGAGNRLDHFQRHGWWRRRVARQPASGQCPGQDVESTVPWWAAAGAVGQGDLWRLPQPARSRQIFGARPQSACRQQRHPYPLCSQSRRPRIDRDLCPRCQRDRAHPQLGRLRRNAGPHLAQFGGAAPGWRHGRHRHVRSQGSQGLGEVGRGRRHWRGLRVASAQGLYSRSRQSDVRQQRHRSLARRQVDLCRGVGQQGGGPFGAGRAGAGQAGYAACGLPRRQSALGTRRPADRRRAERPGKAGVRLLREPRHALHPALAYRSLGHHGE